MVFRRFSIPDEEKIHPEATEGPTMAEKGVQGAKIHPHNATQEQKARQRKTLKNRHKCKQLFTFFHTKPPPVLNFRLFFAPTNKRQAKRAFPPPFSPTKSKKHAPNRGVLAVPHYEAVACVLRPSPPSEQPWLGQCGSSHKRLNFS